MMTFKQAWAWHVLSQLALAAPHAFRIAAQLLEVEPCEKCDYVKEHCRCHEAGKGSQ